MGILEAMLKIVLAMVLGFFLYRRHILNDESNMAMSKLITYGAAPCMIFSSVCSLDAGKRSEVITLLIAGVVLYILLAALAFIGALAIRPEKRERGSYEAMMTYGNSAFLAFPIGQALMGDLGVSYLAILNIHQNVFAHSYGVFQLTRGKEGKFKFSPAKLVSPTVICAVIALILYIAGVRVPEPVLVPIDSVGQMTSPLAMVVTGATIASYPFKNLFNNWRYYVAGIIKLTVIPMIAFIIAFAVWGAGNLASVIGLHCCMPTAVIISIIAMINGADYKLISSGTGLMNIMCVGTIPLMWVIFGLFG
ncbi:MAG: AEC family transporter [Lachnospiraceae bacterium]|jgi:predicted permease